MPLGISAPPPSALGVRRRRRPMLLMMALIAAAGLAAWGAGVPSSSPWSSPPPPLATLEVDRGDVAMVVTESGSLESAENATVRCEVEALIGMVGGTAGGGMAGAQGARAGQGGSGSTAPAGGTGGTSVQGGSAPANAAAAAVSSSASPSATTGASSTATTATAADDTDTTTANTKPVIRSFTYQVVPHVPLRPKAVTATPQPKAPPPQDPAASGGGGRGRQNSSTIVTEKPGSTRIISLLPEGTHVKAGDVVCRLDASAFEDALQAQEIRHAQAKAWVDQALALLEVAKITLSEYRDGIFPQDRQLLRQYVATCQLEVDRASKNLNWSRAAASKGVRSTQQVRADTLALRQAEIALREAEGMVYRLEHYTGPKLIKALEAKIEAIRSDKLTQEASFQLEDERLRKLQRMVANCTMKAPRDGIVVFANQSNQWGRVEVQIDEGVTVREGQPIFQLPDPRHMQVKARINESKVALIRPGQPASIRIDAFPDRPLKGIVTEITAIPAPVNRASPDIKVYFATVKLDAGGFDALRPGLSAEVTFDVRSRQDVPRVPLQAIRWLGDEAFVAVVSPSRTSWHWRRVELGLSDRSYAEVTSGLEVGEQVVAHPDHLPTPRAAVTVEAVAGTAGRKRG